MKRLNLKGFIVLVVIFLLSKLIFADQYFKPFGVLQFYYNLTFGNDNNSNQSMFSLYKTGIGFKGNYNEYISYKCQIAYNRFNNSIIPYDLYGKIRLSKNVDIRFGLAKVPFSLERVKPLPFRDFISTSIVTNIVPSRDIGVTLWANTKYLDFNVGIYNGTYFNPEIDVSKNYLARLILKPLKYLKIGGVFLKDNQRSSNIYEGQFGVYFKYISLEGEYAVIFNNDWYLANFNKYYNNFVTGKIATKININKEILKKIEIVLRLSYGANTKLSNVIYEIATNYYIFNNNIRFQLNYKYDNANSIVFMSQILFP